MWPETLDPQEPDGKMLKNIVLDDSTARGSSALLWKHLLKTRPSTANTECWVLSKKFISLQLKPSVTPEILPFHMKFMSCVSHSQHPLSNETEEGRQESTIFLNENWYETWMIGDVKDKGAVLQGSHVPECYQPCLPNDMDIHFSYGEASGFYATDN